jgi:RNA polymerase sigma-70 factor (ECF subfamily)
LTRDEQAIRDELLVLRCQCGEAAAFSELFRQWEQRLFYYVRRLVPQEADAWDTLQKTWLKVVRDIRRLRHPAALRVWLYRLARNTAVSHFRLELALRGRLESEVNVGDTVCSEELSRLENAELVHHTLGRLPLSFREVLTLHFLEDMPLLEMSAVLGVPVGTVKSRLYYAKRAMRDLLLSEGKMP